MSGRGGHNRHPYAAAAEDAWTTMATPTTARRRRMLWTAALLLPCAAAADSGRRHPDEGGVRKRRRRQPRDLHEHQHHRPRHPNKPDVPTIRRLAIECTADEQPFVLTFQTDNYGDETSWFLKTNPTDGSAGTFLGSGPSHGSPYGDHTLYSFHYCLSIGSTYTLAMEDNFGDGMCCARGYGGYEYKLGGKLIYSTYLRHTFKDYVEHTFTVEGQYLSPAPTWEPTSEPVEEECVPNPTVCGCDDVEQEDYRGTLAVTENGLSCSPWNLHYTPQDYPDDGLSENYCRSPGGGWPWCYTSDPDVEWEWCRVPACPTQAVVTTQAPAPPTNAPVVVGSPTGSPTEPPTYAPSFNPTTSPTPLPTMPPTPNPTPPPNVQNAETGCFGGDVQFRVEVRADFFHADVSWDLIDQKTGVVVIQELPGSYTVRDQYRATQTCIPHGTYTFITKDIYGDGWCCRYGEGFFKVHLDGMEVLNGGSFNENMTATLNVGYQPHGYMTQREKEYLVAHNVRRKEWHEQYNLTYVPLQYSPALAAQSKAWAEELLHSCSVVGIEHENSNPFGENLAKNTGNADTWGKLYPPDNIVGRWVDFEIGLPYPSNGHLTQALWRASKYLGCGESSKPFRKGVCRIQVCRYGRAGNCDMARFEATVGENWLVPMLDNYTRCGPDCPPEGCFRSSDESLEF